MSDSDSDAAPERSANRDPMPLFSFRAYRDVLVRLRASGFSCRPVSAMRESSGQVAFIRHDIDFFISPALSFAELEADLGIAATYYVLLTGKYNPRSAVAVAELRRLIDLGHEIGLHYDLETYPENGAEARVRLENEIAQLEDLTEQSVTTISMHQPGLAGGDAFRQTDDWVHPHDPRLQGDLLYVSDSCRGWRDTSLLECFGSTAPRRLLWLTHPELYLDGSIGDREEYLDRILLPAALADIRRYFDDEVRSLWRQAEGARLHDDRIATLNRA